MTVTASRSDAATASTTSTSRSQPGALGPLIRNCWYVVGARAEFDRTLKQRWILGEPVCYYQAADGTPVVLDDRCAHRRFPLSRSSLDGDAIVCGYHGFTYGADGQCLRIPGGGDPRAVRVRRYPTVQRGPWVWIWTGSEPEAADPALIPWPAAADGDGDFVTGYTHNPANYSMLHENLLDLTHIEYLHKMAQDGFAGYTDAGLELFDADQLPQGFNDVAVGYRISAETDAGLWGTAGGDGPDIAVRRTEDLIFVGPAITYGVGELSPIDSAVTLRMNKYVLTHCLTPVDENNTHQFWSYWQNAPLAVPHEEWAALLAQVFDQDVEALGWIQEYVERDHRPGVIERSAAKDAAGLRVRRKLQRLAAQENAAGDYLPAGSNTLRGR
jgi:phenylpropionate dioxygenase-like ring-hydroxylating dioxygenase large terminal subunit